MATTISAMPMNAILRESESVELKKTLAELKQGLISMVAKHYTVIDSAIK
jgi:hypothetical protein